MVICINKECPSSNQGNCCLGHPNCKDRQVLNKLDFNLRGDEITVLNKIKDYIPYTREDLWSWICYFENELKEKLK